MTPEPTPNYIPATTEKTPARPAEAPPTNISERLQKLIVTVQENANDKLAWQEIAKTLEAARQQASTQTREQWQTLMSQVDRLQQYVISTPESKDRFELINSVKQRIQDIRTDTYQRIQDTVSAVSALPGAVTEGFEKVNAMTGGWLKNMIPGSAMFGTLLSADGIGGFISRAVQQMYHRAFEWAGKTQLFFGMDLKSVFGDVFTSHEQAIADLKLESALRSSIAALNKAQKQNNRPLFTLAPDWSADIEAKTALQNAAGAQPFEQFVTGKFTGEYAKVFGGGPVSLKRLADAMEGKKVQVQQPLAKAPEAPAATPAKAVTPEKPEGTVANTLAT